MPNLAIVLPSSLIFVLILALWAGYLVHHWVQRRDHVATARMYDRYSEAMRVLDVQGQRLSTSATPSRSYAESPMRPMKKSFSAVAVASAAASSAGVSAQRTKARKPKNHGALLATPRSRAGVLLVSVLLMLLSSVLAVVGVWSWIAFGASVAVFALSIVAVRASAKKSHGARSSTPQVAAASVPKRVSVSAKPTPRIPQEASAPVAAKRESSELYDIQEVERLERPAPTPAKPAPVAAEGTWIPVPVPAPTYTMKAKAGVPATRVTVPEPVPFDGMAMAFEEESEDLPSVKNFG